MYMISISPPGPYKGTRDCMQQHLPSYHDSTKALKGIIKRIKEYRYEGRNMFLIEGLHDERKIALMTLGIDVWLTVCKGPFSQNRLDEFSENR